MWTRDKHKAKKHNLKQNKKQTMQREINSMLTSVLRHVASYLIFCFLLDQKALEFRNLEEYDVAYSTDFYFAFVLLKTKTKFKNLKRCTFIIALKLGTHFREKRL